MEAARSLQIKSLENFRCKHISPEHSKLQCSVRVLVGFVFGGGCMSTFSRLLTEKPVEVFVFCRQRKYLFFTLHMTELQLGFRKKKTKTT